MSKKVLVVDDSSSIRQRVTAALVAAGFEVVAAVDGLDGLAKLGAAKDLALVIADINMPRLNGLEMISRIRLDEKTAGIPILVLTTEGDPELIAEARKLGVKAWMVKPFKDELLVSAVTKLTTG
jgi:two-component system chemotaxis response regulator CheY